LERSFERISTAKPPTRGLAAAKDLKLFLGELIYLEFRPFQEIVISRRDSAEEAPVPAFILALSEDK
jgi:hypothetical protein